MLLASFLVIYPKNRLYYKYMVKRRNYATPSLVTVISLIRSVLTVKIIFVCCKNRKRHCMSKINLLEGIKSTKLYFSISRNRLSHLPTNMRLKIELNNLLSFGRWPPLRRPTVIYFIGEREKYKRPRQRRRAAVAEGRLKNI